MLLTDHCEQGKMQSENLLRTECGGYESDEGGQRVGQHYYNPHQYNNVGRQSVDTVLISPLQGQY